MSTTTKMRVFVPANKPGRGTDVPYRFPRIRIIAMMRHFLDDQTMRETITTVDNEWAGFQDEHLRHQPGYGVGIVLTFITDDSGLGRVLRAMHRHDSFGYEIMDLEELSEVGTFTHKRSTS